ncbi:serine hydrolase domain-containing protein [Streptomyces sp. AN091965]|uniref:serine hydrolase domain-containing protein n=1 Tax=Streptomyces sp. AN091965 TaxID=2927803 RepID=UPI001F606BF7|nr:serine hydrolase domain-containing protein [Streptomyces sp. AN091965]MCI3935482.1 beta-lactamase family protein [Streptomyces sp. AN091965]MCI3935484.1 beta-lactamase family protein [Streptomyces sp. AN091965]
MPYTTAATIIERSPSRLREALQDRLDVLARAHRVPGAHLTVDTGTDVVSVHTGTTDASTGTPFTADTAVPLGSVTKVYTAAAVMLLADDGDLEPDDPAASFIPELRALPEVTIRHLLSHTAGLPTGPDSDTAAGATVSRYLAEVCAARDTLFAPGAGFSYSNAGYIAAGRIIESVTGMTWKEAVRALLLEPLGTTAAYLGEPAATRKAAVGHALNTATGQPRPARQNLAAVEAPAGALLASALDLAALGRSLIGRSAVLPPAVAALMRTPVPGADPGVLADAWGLGVALFKEDGRWWCGHDGNAQGTSCHLRAEPDSGVVVAFTGNAGGATALWQDLADDLTRLTGVRVPTAPAPAQRGEPIALPECVGTYRNGALEYRITLDVDGSPVLSVDGDLPLPLVCYADLTCDLVDPATGRREPGGRFHRDAATGTVDRVQISGRTARRTRTS